MCSLPRLRALPAARSISKAGPRGGGASQAPSSPSTEAPSGETPGGGNGGNTGGGSGSGDGATKDPAKVLEPVTKPVEKTVATVAELTTVCTKAVVDQLGAVLARTVPRSTITDCVAQLQGKTLPEATGAVGGILTGLLKLLGLVK